MLPLTNVACANMTREQVEVAEASFSTSIIEHVSELGHGLGSEAGNTNRLDGVVDEQGNVTDASILQGLRMVVPVSSENRAVDPLGNLAVNMGELVQLGGVSGRDSVVMARQDVLLDDGPFSRGSNDTAEIGRSHHAASGLVLGSQGGFLGGLPGPANEEGSSAANAHAFVQGSDWSNWFSEAVGGLGLLEPTPGLLNPEPMLNISRGHYDELVACKEMLGKLLPEYQNL